MTIAPLSLLFGTVVGLSLGLTGGGGAIFAVPLLVYGLSVPTREAVGISLASVGATSLLGFLHRWKLGEVEVRTGLVFAAAGMVGAPLGAWLARLLPEALLLSLFAALMAFVAARLWRRARPLPASAARCESKDGGSGPACGRDAEGTLALSSRCAGVLIAVGTLTGVLSGLFGVGGGFVIVPALVLFSRMSIHRAVGTSLLVIALVSVSGVVSQLSTGTQISPELTALFVAGGIGGLFAGQQIARRLSGPALQRTFSAAMLAVAAFVIVRNLKA